jgi:hypothetical protein
MNECVCHVSGVCTIRLRLHHASFWNASIRLGQEILGQIEKLRKIWDKARLSDF